LDSVKQWCCFASSHTPLVANCGETAQRSIAYTEQKAALDFGALSPVDPLRKGEESISPLLTDFSQIRFHMKAGRSHGLFERKEAVDVGD
jgi:hypothetical protein